MVVGVSSSAGVEKREILGLGGCVGSDSVCEGG